MLQVVDGAAALLELFKESLTLSAKQFDLAEQCVEWGWLGRGGVGTFRGHAYSYA